MEVGTPDAAWKRARLATASPSPPLRANGASSAARCTTRTARPSDIASGGGSAAARGSAATARLAVEGLGAAIVEPACRFISPRAGVRTTGLLTIRAGRLNRYVPDL